jgi:four helix bundle protein
MSNDSMTNKNKYDLEERTAKFGKNVLELVKIVPENSITRPLISQLVRSATSIGANYCEADDAESVKDFKHKLCICKKEARETKHWLKMLIIAVPAIEERAQILIQEAKELNLIFNAIVNKIKIKI